MSLLSILNEFIGKEKSAYMELEKNEKILSMFLTTESWNVYEYVQLFARCTTLIRN